MPDFDADSVVMTNSSDKTVGLALIQYDWPVALCQKCSTLHNIITILWFVNS